MKIGDRVRVHSAEKHGKKHNGKTGVIVDRADKSNSDLDFGVRLADGRVYDFYAGELEVIK